jgi:hypothetical protein
MKLVPVHVSLVKIDRSRIDLRDIYASEHDEYDADNDDNRASDDSHELGRLGNCE